MNLFEKLWYELSELFKVLWYIMRDWLDWKANKE
jgi:hypothetical protein